MPTVDSLVVLVWFKASSSSPRSSEESSEPVESVFPLPRLDFPLDSLEESDVCPRQRHPFEHKEHFSCEQHLEAEQPMNQR